MIQVTELFILEMFFYLSFYPGITTPINYFFFLNKNMHCYFKTDRDT